MIKLAAALSLGLALPAAAAPVAYTCQFSRGAGGGYIGPVIVVTHDAAAGAGTVLDGLIQETKGGPIGANVRGSADRLVVRWGLTGFRNTAGQASQRLAYELRIGLADGAARATMRPAGYRGTYSTNGRCTRSG